MVTSAGHPAPRFDGGSRPPASRKSLLRGLLLAGHLHALGPLARTGVRLRVLPAHGQAAAMTHPAIAADLHQALDVLRALATQIDLDGEVVDRVAELGNLVLGEIANLAVGLDPGRLEDLVGGRTADAVDVRQPDLGALVQGDVDAGDPRHAYPCLC